MGLQVGQVGFKLPLRLPSVTASTSVFAPLPPLPLLPYLALLHEATAAFGAA